MYYPEATLERFDPSSEFTNADSLVFLVSFDQPVANVDLSDFETTGTTGTPTAISTAAAGLEYEPTVSGNDLATYEGSVELTLAGSCDIEADTPDALALLGCRIGTSETYTLDNTIPAVTTVAVDTDPVYDGDLTQLLTVRFDSATDTSIAPASSISEGESASRLDGSWTVGDTV